MKKALIPHPSSFLMTFQAIATPVSLWGDRNFMQVGGATAYLLPVRQEKNE